MASQRIKIMTLNLRFGLADDGPNSWTHRCNAYPALIANFPCEFYAFQEANDFQIEFLASILADYHWIGQRQPAPDRWQNNVIFYRQDWHCVTQDHFYLSTTPDQPSKFSASRWPRQCTIGRFKRGGQMLICTNTHFDFDPEVQRRSAMLIQTRLQQHGIENPTLLMGDFNADPSSSCYEVFTSETETGDPFRNAFNALAQGGTYHGFEGNSNGPPIDWILYRGDLNVLGAQTITRQFNGYYPSDHFPLTATFSWSGEGFETTSSAI